MIPIVLRAYHRKKGVIFFFVGRSRLIVFPTQQISFLSQQTIYPARQIIFRTRLIVFRSRQIIFCSRQTIGSFRFLIGWPCITRKPARLTFGCVRFIAGCTRFFVWCRQQLINRGKKGSAAGKESFFASSKVLVRVLMKRIKRNVVQECRTKFLLPKDHLPG